MGEAKRRKAKDATWGKPFSELPRQAQIERATAWRKEAERHRPDGYKKDYGHWYAETFGSKPINMAITPPYGILPDRAGRMLVATGESSCISVLINNEQFSSYVEGQTNQTLNMCLEIAPEYRYQAPTGEFVIPFVVHSFKPS